MTRILAHIFLVVSLVLQPLAEMPIGGCEPPSTQIAVGCVCCAEDQDCGAAAERCACGGSDERSPAPERTRIEAPRGFATVVPTFESNTFADVRSLPRPIFHAGPLPKRSATSLHAVLCVWLT